MSKHTEAQILYAGDKPAFAVIPYYRYLELTKDEKTLLPDEVVGITVKQDCNLLKAWRLHLGFTQKELAEKAGITQAALSQMEKSENPHSATINKLAAAMGIETARLTDD